ncbi:hypothetical protein Vau01_045590 [Virgisporangium aurantiacum]|uniref:Uncharacterized protein n=1 Tax=Virgisporangium aurantiacum TaxID=175570 RepID=A0A8J4E0T4_9ACTN|nr:hypothetical protein Vau01_045590 [Virgisporangium aurantiacum]
MATGGSGDITTVRRFTTGSDVAAGVSRLRAGGIGAALCLALATCECQPNGMEPPEGGP